jgi:ParB family chromosome partitioning protein
MKPTQQKPQLAASLFGQSAPNAPKIRELALSDIQPNPDQPRQLFDEASLQELAASIERHGLLQPITVKKGEGEQYVLVAGERRFRAHQLLGKSKIPALILASGNSDELALIENIQREDLGPLEEAQALAKLMERHGYTQEALGKVIGKAQATVSNLLNLNTLPDSIKQEYSTSNNRVSKSLLMEIARHSDPDEQIQLWEAAKTGATTVRTARQAKKTGTTSQPHPAQQAIQTGKRFAQKLASLEALSSEHADEIAALLETLQTQLAQLRR